MADNTDIRGIWTYRSFAKTPEAPSKARFYF